MPEDRRQAQPPGGGHPEGQQKGPQTGPHGHAHTITGHAAQFPFGRQIHALRQPGQQQAARDDAAVVDQGRQRGHAKLPPHVEQGRDAGPAQEEDLRGQDDAHEKGQPCRLGGIEARGRDAGQLLGAQHARPRHQQRGHHHPAEDAGEKAPAVVLVLLEAPGQQGDDGDGHDAPGQQVVDDVRHHEGREVHVRFTARAELPGDDLVAHQSHEAGQDGAGGQDQGRRAHALFLREKAHPRLPRPAGRRAPRPPSRRACPLPRTGRCPSRSRPLR